MTSELKERFHVKSDRTRNVDNLISKYTMDSERKVHSKYSDINKINKESEIVKKEEVTDDYFGDNVDLF